MRTSLAIIGMLALTQVVACVAQAGALRDASTSQARQQALQTQQSRPPMPAGQLVREVVYNELHDHQGHGYWRYWVERRTPNETQLSDQVETAEGPVTRLALTNGRPLTAVSQQVEQTRLQTLLSSPGEQARVRQEYLEEEQRIGRLMAVMPDAFLYQYDGEEDGCHRLSFHPNPDYPAHSIEARIFHAMSGMMWIDPRMKRLVRLDAHVEKDVDFGYGILGRLYKGGWVQFRRTQVSETDWKTEHLEVHMLGRALLVKPFARETSETRGGFVPVPPGMNLAEGSALLQKTAARTRRPAEGALATSAALALRR
jgi:hypothetical protein